MKKIVEKVPNRLHHTLGISTLIISLSLIGLFVYNIIPIMHTIHSDGPLGLIVGILAVVLLAYGFIVLFKFLYLKIKESLFRKFGHIKFITDIVHIIKWCFVIIGCVLLVTGAIAIILFLIKTRY